ncbi:related to protoporphyrinogen oxidase [Cephalotrichum gorgonifer]|uniref:Related to protoporphyrinogen oxidase n=1 Tax=Cephalotrichum gorgonifer TaxID=2041049 RepID=A0AAE8N8G7_9PEZI|nr:related to protoporphyrinogen oxidase [Cephalotrichum gorgonifer]
MPTYVITGARAGIGLEYIRQLSTSPDNTIVALVRDVNAAGMTGLNNILSSSDTRAQVHILEGNLASPKSLASLPSRLPQGLKIDVLIQNAAILLPTARSEKASTVAAESLNAHFSTNVIGPALLLQALVPLLTPGAVVANISSGVGSMAWIVDGRVNAEYPAYSISKAALNMLTVHQAAELKGKAIVVCVDPGWVKTEMGGPGALVEAADSARNVLRTLSGLKEEDTGNFMFNDGTPEPW